MNNELKLFKSNYRLYFKKCLKIRNKNSEIVFFLPNQEQEQLIDLIEDWKKKYPNAKTRPTLYVVIPKPRQVGYSTVTEAMFFHDLNFGFNKVAMIISYDEDSAATINDMSNRFYQYLPQVIKPMKRKSLGKGILFENPKFDPSKPISETNDPGLQNKFLIETARNVNAGSSYTINYLHISELAKWQTPEETLTSLLQSVPKNDAIVIVESTAKGLNYFYELCRDAKEGKNNYKLIFIPWFKHKEYASPYTGFELTEEEKQLQRTYELTLDQLQWRRDTIKDKCQNKLDIFHQEYPSYLEEAFITTGKPVFDNGKLLERKAELEKIRPGTKGNLKYNKENKLEFIPNENGIITIYEMPQAHKSYVGGFDIAEGKEEGDFDAGHILDNSTLMQVAKIHCHIDVHTYSEEIYKLGEFYNTALMAPETNYNIGTTVNLERMNYPKIYMRTTEHTITKAIKKEFGFNTNKVTKPVIIADLVEYVLEHIDLINDIETIDEMLVFVNNNGKLGGMSGKHDDLVMAYAIALHAALSGQQTKTVAPKACDISKLPKDLQDDYNNAPADMKQYLLRKWGYVK